MAEPTYNERVVATIKQRAGTGDATGLTALVSALGLSPEEAAALQAQLAGVSSGAAGKPTTTIAPQIYSPTDANAKIVSVFQTLFNREPTQAELNEWRPKLIAEQKKTASAAKTGYKRTGETVYQPTTTGLNEAEWLKEQLTALPKYQKELKDIALTPTSIAQRAKDKQLYMDALQGAVNDPAKLQQLDRTTAYGLAIQGLKDRIKAEADRAGATYTESDLTNWAKEAYDTNQDLNAYTFNKFIDGKMQFVGAGYKGQALDTFNSLRDVAVANGIDLNQAFGAQLPDWVKAINDGANIEQYKQMIRDVAKLGMPDNVKKMLDNGVDLGTIYSPYQNMMESTLELPRGSVTLNDPYLRSAITQNGEMPLYDFQRQLRNDPRWGFTDAARNQVASTTLDILRRFGFMG